MFKNYKPSKYTSYLLFLLPLFFFFFINMSRETDIWFLLSHGREILNNGIPHTEFLTIHNGLYFVMQQWLSSLLFYVIYNYLGNLGLYIFIMIINLLIIFFLYKLCMVITNNKVYKSVLITVITDLLLELLFIVPRPQIFSILILIIELYLLELFINKKSNKSIYFIILLSVLLINLHSSIWPILFIFMGPYLVELIFKKDKRFIKLLIVFLLSILIGFINPYGIESMTYFMRSYGIKDINLHIVEMHHIGFIDKETSWLSILLIIYSIIIYYLTYKNRGKVSIHQILFLLGTTFMAYMNLRNSSLFFISTLPFVSKFININDGKDSIIPVSAYVTCSIIILMAFTMTIINKNYVIKSDTEKIVKYLDKNTNKDIRLFTNFNDGPYFEFNNYKVYIDTRAEVFLKSNNKKEDILIEYIDVITNKKDINKFLDKYDFDYLLVMKKDLLYKHLKKHKKYDLVYNYKDYNLFKRDNKN